MVVVETNKKVFLLYQSPKQYNMYCIEAFNVHIKSIKAHHGSIGYHLVPTAATLLEEHKTTGEIQSKNRIYRIKLRQDRNIGPVCY